MLYNELCKNKIVNGHNIYECALKLELYIQYFHVMCFVAL